MNILDELRILVWQNTKNGRDGMNIPQSIYRILCLEETEKQKAPEQYEEPEDFDREWKKLTGAKHE